MMADQQAEIATFNLRLTNAEQEIKRIQERFDLYVPQRENTIELKTIERAIERTENDQKNAKQEQSQQFKDLNEKIEKLDEKIDKQGEKIDKLQIRGLTWIVITFVGIVISVVTTVASSLIVYYLTRPGG